MRKVLSSLLILVIVIVSITPVYAVGDIKTSESNLNLKKEDKLLLQNTYFLPNNIHEFNGYSGEKVVFIVQDFIIMKKNLNQDFTINIDSLTEDNILREPVSENGIQPFAITEKYVSLPSGKHTATTYWTVETRGYGQKTTSMYLTPNAANLYIAKNQHSGQRSAIEYLLGAAVLKLSPSVGAVYQIALTIADIIDKDFYYNISQRSTNNKPVMISVFSSNIGSGRTVKDWNGRTVRSRNGKSSSPHLTTTEKTTIYWSSGR